MTDKTPGDPWVPLTDWARATHERTSEERAVFIAFDGANPFYLSHAQLTAYTDGTVHLGECRDPEALAGFEQLRQRARVRFPWSTAPTNWPTWVARLERAQARRIRRHRIRATLRLVAALAVAGFAFTAITATIAEGMWWPAVPVWVFVWIPAIVWVIEEYRELRQALRARAVDIPRRRP